MAQIGLTDKDLLEDVFDMGGGYVLDFTNQTFARFFSDEIGINIEDERYFEFGSSKAKRFRCFLSLADNKTAAKAIMALWEYREARRVRRRHPEHVDSAQSRMDALLKALGGAPVARQPSSAKPSGEVIENAQLGKLKDDLLGLPRLEAQARGYAFEAFLKKFFDAFGLSAREAFRLRGEQIDGSFQLGHETYLLEAKWQNAQTGVADLHAFHGKLEQKASWTRGLFVSNSGFTDDGLVAFGRGRRLVCMDGLDLYDIMRRGLPLDEALGRKIRRAAETGHPFTRIRDLYPQ